MTVSENVPSSNGMRPSANQRGLYHQSSGAACDAVRQAALHVIINADLQD